MIELSEKKKMKDKRRALEYKSITLSEEQEKEIQYFFKEIEKQILKYLNFLW